MKKRDHGRVPTLLIWAFLVLYPLNVFADGPTVRFKSTVEQVIQILTNPQLQGEGKARTSEKAARGYLCSLRFPADGATYVRGALAAPNPRRAGGVYKGLW